MIYIQLSRDDTGIGFLTLAKTGTVLCLPDDTYGVTPEHLKVLRRKRIRFKKLEASTVRLPLAARYLILNMNN